VAKKYHSRILNHYKKVAKNNGLSPRSSMEDPVIRDSEIEFFLTEIDEVIKLKGDEISILEVGCGNGHLLSLLSWRFKKAKICALEFTPELYEQAKSRGLTNVEVRHGDCVESLQFEGPFDVVITERVIINIINRRDQNKALENIGAAMKIGGLYLLSESFMEPLREINQARQEMMLDQLNESGHNLYIGEMIVRWVAKFGLEEVHEHVKMARNHLSTHFFLTRVFHKSVMPEGGKGKYTHFSDFFEKALPPAVGNYSPILFRKFMKVREADPPGLIQGPPDQAE